MSRAVAPIAVVAALLLVVGVEEEDDTLALDDLPETGVGIPAALAGLIALLGTLGLARRS